MVFKIKDYERKIFELIQLSAKELNLPVYVVGGYVRDRLLARESKDLDVVCVGDGIALAEKLASKLRLIGAEHRLQRRLGKNREGNNCAKKEQERCFFHGGG